MEKNNFNTKDDLEKIQVHVTENDFSVIKVTVELAEDSKLVIVTKVGMQDRKKQEICENFADYGMDVSDREIPLLLALGNQVLEQVLQIIVEPLEMENFADIVVTTVVKAYIVDSEELDQA